MYKRIVVTGSLAFDQIMSMPGRFADHILPDKIHILNVSFIMQTLRKEFGGTGGNIAYSLALHKIPTLLVGVAGSDFETYEKHLKKLPALTRKISLFKKESCASGFAITDRDDNQIWGFYEGAMKYTSKLTLLKTLKRGDFLVLAPNDPKSMMKFAKEAEKLKIPFLFDPAFNIPHLSLTDLRFAIKKCAVLIGNDYEIELISKRLKMPKTKLVTAKQLLITTLGARGSEIISGGKSIKIAAAKPINASDPTGAGDAFRAGFLAGIIKDLPLEQCGRMGSVTAAYTVEKYGTQTHKFTPSEFKKRFDLNFQKIQKKPTVSSK